MPYTDQDFPDFMSDPSTKAFEAPKESVPGAYASLPPGVTTAMVARFGDLNRLWAAVDQLRTFNLQPLEARSIPYENLTPNSQFQLATLFGPGNKMLAAGTGEMPALTITSYTTGSNTVTASTTNTGTVKAGDLLQFSAAAHADVKLSPVRVSSFVVNTSVTFGLPLGRLGQSSAACTAQPIDSGGSSSAGTGDAWNGWSKTTSLKVWREDNPANLKAGGAYSGGALKASSSRENAYVSPDSKALPRLRGKRIVFGAGVKGSVTGTGTWRAYINVDGVETFSASLGSSTTFQWAEVTALVGVTAASVTYGIAFDGAAGDAFYISQPMFGIGDYLGDWNYCQRPDELHILKVHCNPITLLGANVLWPTSPTSSSDNTAAFGGGVGDDFSFKLRTYAETSGAIAGTVRAIGMQLEAKSAAVTLQRSNALKTLLVECVTGGARGTATFRVSSDSGSTWSSVLTSVSGVTNIQWVSGTFGSDANNGDVKYQVFSCGNGGSYTSGNRWTINTDGTYSRTTGSGYDGISIAPVSQAVAIGTRNQFSAPTVFGQILYAQVAGVMQSQAALVPVDLLGDVDIYTGTMNASWTSATIDINAVLLS